MSVRVQVPPRVLKTAIVIYYCGFFKIVLQNKNKFLFLQSEKQWSVRLGVRTPGFHPGNRGSIPLRTTIFEIITRKYQLSILVRSSRG